MARFFGSPHRGDYQRNERNNESASRPVHGTIRERSGAVNLHSGFDVVHSSPLSSRTADGGRDFERFNSLLTYDPSTGELRWKVSRSNQIIAGQIAGCSVGSRYVTIHCGAKKFAAHRIAWLLFYGRWPSGLLDHIDRNTLNNKISNLREATFCQNGANTVTRRGYYFDAERKKWRAEISANGRRVRLGRFESEAEARAAYIAAHIKFHDDFSPYASEAH